MIKYNLPDPFDTANIETLSVDIYPPCTIPECPPKMQGFDLTGKTAAGQTIYATDPPEKPAAKTEPVHHPSYYNYLPVECIDVVQHMPFCLGAAIKYVWRCGRKPYESAQQDLRKAIWYLHKHIELLDKQSKPAP